MVNVARVVGPASRPAGRVRSAKAVLLINGISYLAG